MDFEFLSQRRDVKSRSISAENKNGEKNAGALSTGNLAAGPARELGAGWKVSPCITILPNETVELANIADEGVIKSIWMTNTKAPRLLILRVYWDNNPQPSIEVPLGDFFACANGEYRQNNSLMVNMNPGRGFACSWPMPFKTNCRMTIENLNAEELHLFYQINYELKKLPEKVSYLHAQFNRENPTKYMRPYTILEKVDGRGHYVGTYLFWQVNSNGWWGEGEIKFFMDGDVNPTICGTGTEDYFCGAWNFEHPSEKRYVEFSSPYTGLSVYKADNLYTANMRFSMYRWHLTDPIYFDENLSVTIQALGWRSEKRYLPLQDDISSVALYYLEGNPAAVKPVPDKNSLEII